MGDRKTVMLPSILTPYNQARAGQNATPKPTPVNLRKFAETPVARRAINVVKDKIASMDWKIKLRRGYSGADVPDASQRIAALRHALEEPNVSDSFRTLFEQALEDLLVGGFGAIEMEATGDDLRPFHLWAVDGATIQIDVTWDGDPAKPRYAQATGGLGSKGLIPLLDDELMYLRLNPRTHTPFGLGRLEVAFETVNQFLSANRYAGRLASNSVVQYALWLNEATPEQHDRLIRWWQDEIEGTGRVPLLSCEQKPEVLRFAGGTDADLRIQWQQFLLMMIANAFELPPMLLGLQADVNRSTASEMADEAFQSAVVPVAKLLAEHITRDLFAKKLGWREFEFSFNDLETRNEMEEVQMQTELLKAGVLTTDEVRELRGLSPSKQAE
jgi:phage portal protein BeeE